MADDERRAEIEAVARALAEIRWRGQDLEMAMREYGGPNGWLMTDARAAIRALDRVRDARGDDEGYGPLPVMDSDWQAKMAAAWSPQGEDHEAVEAALDAIEGYAQALTDQRGWGATRRAICENAQKVRTYLSRVSPPRDGTVAVEQPEPDALGGPPPSQPKEDQR